MFEVRSEENMRPGRRARYPFSRGSVFGAFYLSVLGFDCWGGGIPRCFEDEIEIKQEISGGGELGGSKLAKISYPEKKLVNVYILLQVFGVASLLS